MLLSARVTDGRFLDAWLSGGAHKVVDPGIYPRFWSLYQRPGSIPVKKRLLSDITKEVVLYRMDVDRTYDVRQLRDEESLEANIPFIQLLVMLKGFTHGDDKVSHAAWDIETITAGQYPPIGKAPISELSWYSPSRQEVLQGDEKSIIEGFVDICKNEDVDLLDTYNGDRFDWRVIEARARVNKVRLAVDRVGGSPGVRGYERRFGKFRGVDYTVFMAGRLSFDVWKETRQDTSLTGNVQNRSLKTVARYMFPDDEFIELDRARLQAYTPAERAEYCLSDARATYMLAEHYLEILKMLAVELRAPLDLILRRSPSHVGNYVYGKEFKSLNVVSDGANFKRFEGILW